MALRARKPVADSDGSAAPFSVATGIKSADPWLKLFFYGDFGAGKTVLSAQAVDIPRMRDVLFLNAEAGLKSVKESDAVENYEDIDSILVQDYETFVSVHRMLVAHCQARDAGDESRLERMAQKYGYNPERRYKTVVIDSLSEIENMNFARIIGMESDDLLQDMPETTFTDYGRNRQMLHKIVRAFRNLPMNVIVTCGADWDQDEKKKYKMQPRLTGKLSKDVQAFFDVVGFVQTAAQSSKDDSGDSTGGSTMARRLWLQPIGKFDAKSRLTPQDVGFIDDPTMKKLISRLTRKSGSK